MVRASVRDSATRFHGWLIWLPRLDQERLRMWAWGRCTCSQFRSIQTPLSQRKPAWASHVHFPRVLNSQRRVTPASNLDAILVKIIPVISRVRSTTFIVKRFSLLPCPDWSHEFYLLISSLIVLFAYTGGRHYQIRPTKRFPESFCPTLKPKLLRLIRWALGFFDQLDYIWLSWTTAPNQGNWTLEHEWKFTSDIAQW